MNSCLPQGYQSKANEILRVWTCSTDSTYLADNNYLDIHDIQVIVIHDMQVIYDFFIISLKLLDKYLQGFIYEDEVFGINIYPYIVPMIIL